MFEAEVDEQRALASDTDQIKEWKQELKRLDTGVIPKNNTDTASSAILRDVMLRSFARIGETLMPAIREL